MSLCEECRWDLGDGHAPNCTRALLCIHCGAQFGDNPNATRVIRIAGRQVIECPACLRRMYLAAYEER
jgi:DNA-directed RNA polymerase subunit RPC12/RpoP